MDDILKDLEQVKVNLNELLYNSNTIDSMCENRIKLENAIDVLESGIKDIAKIKM